jgi:hypothetical protein
VQQTASTLQLETVSTGHAGSLVIATQPNSAYVRLGLNWSRFKSFSLTQAVSSFRVCVDVSTLSTLRAADRRSLTARRTAR